MPFVTQNSFNRGEVSERAVAREDVDFYASAVLKMKNWDPSPLGSAARRTPWWHVRGDGPLGAGEFVSTPAADAFVFSVPFETFRTVVYIYVDQTGVTGDFYVTVTTVSDRSGSEPYARWGQAPSLIVDEPLSTGEDTRGANGAWDLAANVTYAVFGKSVFVASPYFPPFRIFEDVAGSSLTFEQSSWYEELVGSINVDLATSATTVNGTDTLFTEQLSAGDLVRIRGELKEVDTVTNDTTFDVVVGDGFSESFAGERAAKEWTSPFGGENPKLVSVFRSRLVFCTTDSSPTRLWASKTTDPFVIRPGSTYDNAPLEVDLFAEGASAFQWVAAQDSLFLGAARGEYALALDQGVGLTPTNFSFVRVGGVGGSAIPPAFSDATTYFVGNDRRALYATQFDFRREGLVTQDLTVLNPEIIDSDIRALALKTSSDVDPADRLYVLLESGDIRVFTKNDIRGVQAWSRNETESNTAGNVGVFALDSEIFLVNIEDASPGDIALFTAGTQDDVPGVCDFPRSLSVGGSGTVALPFYLQGAALAVWDQDDEFVDIIDAATSLDMSGYSSVTSVTVALPVTNEIRLLPAVISERGVGSSMNRKQRVPRAAAHVYETNDLTYNGHEILPITPNTVPNYRTGTFRRWTLGWSFRNEDVIQSNGLYKATLLSLTREVKT